MKKRFLNAGIVFLVTTLLCAIIVYEEFPKKAGHGYSSFIADRWDIKEKYAKSVERTREEAIQGYNEFLASERKIGAIDIEYMYTPTGEPDRRYATYYVIYDIDGDDIPELHVRTWRDYYIFSYKNGEFYELKAFFSQTANYSFTSNGTFVYWGTSATERSDRWYCFKLDSKGNENGLARFYRIEINKNNYYDEDDVYVFDETEYTMEEWIEKTRKYLYTDEKGWEHIRDKVEWTIFCEEVW